ncbi:hypothetical protein H9P43_007915 [Blastocladiella emersonii ATCC 22665]|nr:hypothetical protein H9P43_007915 [Blastocladiella emersonii ATCC 22665]
MISSPTLLLLATLAIILAASPSLVHAHMAVSSPPPRAAKYNAAWVAAGLPVDYSLTSPLNGADRPLACGHAKGPSVQTVAAGGSVTITIAGGATHGGGHCQFALGYTDDVKQWVVLDTVLDTCLTGALSYPVAIPATAPAGEAVLSWTWFNKSGNREIYQDCIDITVSSSSGSAISGKQLVVANLPGFPTLPEGLAGAKALFDAAPVITIGGNGNGNGNGAALATPAAPPSRVSGKPVYPNSASTTATAAPSATISDTSAAAATHDSTTASTTTASLAKH